MTAIALPPPRSETFTSLTKPVSDQIIIEEDVHLHPWSSIKSIGIAYTAGCGEFGRMENSHVSIDNLNSIISTGFFGIFDGHGGKECSEILLNELPKRYVQNAAKFKSEELCWKETFISLDKHLDNFLRFKSCGAAAACVVIKNIDGFRVISCANIGDVEVMVIRDGKTVKLTEIHDTKNYREVFRVENSGALIVSDFINSRTHLTKCFGSHELKGDKPILLAEPKHRLMVITPELTHIVIATRGVWDILSDEKIQEIVTKNDKDTKTAAQELIDASYSSRKNTTVMVIDVRPLTLI